MAKIRQGSQPRPQKQAVHVGDRVLASPRFATLCPAVVVGVEWTPRPRKPISWERAKQWTVIVQFGNSSQRKGSWDPVWVMPHDQENWIGGMADLSASTRAEWIDAWYEIEDAIKNAAN